MPMISALEVARQIELGTITQVEAIQQYYTAIDRDENTIQAFNYLKSLGTIAKSEAGIGPLSGIAIGIKDIFDTFDMPTEYGSPIYRNHQPKWDAAIVNQARRAGASIIGKTVTTEFAYFEPAKTRNPHDIHHTPGGSSSGSAAGVAAGFFPAAIGSQTGGSTIRPASYCGVSGYKPSFRLFPTIGMKHFSWSLDTIGLFAASVADIAFVAEALSARPLRVDSMENHWRPKIGIYLGDNFDEADPAMQAALETAITLAEKSGANIVELPVSAPLSAAYQVHQTIEAYECGIALGDEFIRHANLFSAKLYEQIKFGQAISPPLYDDARRIARQGRKASHQLFENIDIVLTISAPGAAPANLNTTGKSTFNRLWTLLGVPCVNVPGLSDASGLPLGLQIIAPFGRDLLALQVAHWLELVINRSN